jgi:hypothetical protein
MEHIVLGGANWYIPAPVLPKKEEKRLSATCDKTLKKQR